MRAWQWVAGLGAAAVGLLAASSSTSTDADGGEETGPAPVSPPSPLVGPPVPGLPQGKGVFVRAISHGGPPELFAERMAYLGMEHVFVQSMFHERTVKRVNDQSRYLELGERLRGVGCVPWVWGWPRPESIDQFIDVSLAAMEKLGAPGLLVNVENPWIREPEAAARLMEKCRDALDGRPLGITTYGAGPGRISGFPWEAFASCDFTVPQWYDMHNSLDAGYPMRALERYRAQGYPNIIPAWSAMSQHPPRLMAQMASESPIPAGAVCWWDLYWLLRSRERTEWVRAYQIPPPTRGNIA